MVAGAQLGFGTGPDFAFGDPRVNAAGLGSDSVARATPPASPVAAFEASTGARVNSRSLGSDVAPPRSLFDLDLGDDSAPPPLGASVEAPLFGLGTVDAPAQPPPRFASTSGGGRSVNMGDVQLVAQVTLPAGAEVTEQAIQRATERGLRRAFDDLLDDLEAE